MELDHLAVCATSLEDGVSHVQDLLGINMVRGGKHKQMGTHNQLLSLGPNIYLEVIAIDPNAKPPGRARWFDLDNFGGPARLTNWITRVPDLTAAMRAAPGTFGEIVELSRGKLKLQMVVPENGVLPYDGAYPALVHWHGAEHPAKMLSDSGCRLESLHLVHPEADFLNAVLEPALNMTRVHFETGRNPEMHADIRTPAGIRVLR